MDEKQIKKLITDLLKNLAVKPQDILVTLDEDNTYQAQINLEDQDSGILIGYHGDTIAALQLISGLMLYKQTKEWNRLIINVNDYRQKRQESLEKMAQDAAQKVKFSNEPIALFNLNPFERRIIHNYLNEYPEVVTESQGEGRNRHLVVKLASPGGISENSLTEKDQSLTNEEDQPKTKTSESSPDDKPSA